MKAATFYSFNLIISSTPLLLFSSVVYPKHRWTFRPNCFLLISPIYGRGLKITPTRRNKFHPHNITTLFNSPPSRRPPTLLIPYLCTRVYTNCYIVNYNMPLSNLLPLRLIKINTSTLLLFTSHQKPSKFLLRLI